MSDSTPVHTSLLVAHDLTKTYADGAVKALDSVNLCIDDGEMLAIMGPSGSGKSTLLNMLGALDQPTRGYVAFRGKPLSEMPSLDDFRSSAIGFVFQSFCLLPNLTALENVQLPMFERRWTAADRVRRARDLLETVGMSHRAEQLPTRLSVGERQRVAVARALANEPSVVLADEPTGNLDSQNTRDILDLFSRLHRDHATTLVIVTHETEVAAWAHRVVRMRDGRIVTD